MLLYTHPWDTGALISSLNGLAALMLLEGGPSSGNRAMAVATYREALITMEQNKKVIFSFLWPSTYRIFITNKKSGYFV